MTVLSSNVLLGERKPKSQLSNASFGGLGNWRGWGGKNRHIRMISEGTEGHTTALGYRE